MTNPLDRDPPADRPIKAGRTEPGSTERAAADNGVDGESDVARGTPDEKEAVEELSFDDESVGRIGDPLNPSEIQRDQPADRVMEAGLTEAAMPGQGPTDDDLSPETLIHEDGARSPDESGSGPPADQDLDVTDRANIGAGSGLDEAELGRAKPLDGKHWDGDPDQPLQPAPTVDRDYPVEEQGPGNPEDAQRD